MEHEEKVYMIKFLDQNVSFIQQIKFKLAHQNKNNT